MKTPITWDEGNYLYDADGNIIADYVSQENAARIIPSVNHADALVKALRKAQDHVAISRDYGSDGAADLLLHIAAVIAAYDADRGEGV